MCRENCNGLFFGWGGIFQNCRDGKNVDERCCSYGVTVELVDKSDPLQLEVPVAVRLVKYSQNPEKKLIKEEKDT